MGSAVDFSDSKRVWCCFHSTFAYVVLPQSFRTPLSYQGCFTADPETYPNHSLQSIQVFLHWSYYSDYQSGFYSLFFGSQDLISTMISFNLRINTDRCAKIRGLRHESIGKRQILCFETRLLSRLTQFFFEFPHFVRH